MASLSQSRCLAGTKAFTGLRPRAVARIANGTKYTMKRKDSYMVEVNVGEDEPEDIAVRKFMKKVVESRLIEQLRNRRYQETPREEFKRRTRERIEARKMGIVQPTWEEEYGLDAEVKPFEEFFTTDPNNETGFVDMMYTGDDAFYGGAAGGYIEGGAGTWGSYVTDAGRNGGYMQQQGGYMNQQQGGYIN